MKYSKNVWEQLKSITVERLIKALEKDGWIHDENWRQAYVYYNPKNGNRVTIHFHPGKTYRPKMLKLILESIGWDEKDMRKLKLIK